MVDLEEFRRRRPRRVNARDVAAGCVFCIILLQNGFAVSISFNKSSMDFILRSTTTTTMAHWKTSLSRRFRVLRATFSTVACPHSRVRVRTACCPLLPRCSMTNFATTTTTTDGTQRMASSQRRQSALLFRLRFDGRQRRTTTTTTTTSSSSSSSSSFWGSAPSSSSSSSSKSPLPKQSVSLSSSATSSTFFLKKKKNKKNYRTTKNYVIQIRIKMVKGGDYVFFFVFSFLPSFLPSWCLWCCWKIS